MVESPAARRLRRARETAGWLTGADFARHVGVSPITYNHHENGRREITRDSAKKYAQGLGISAGALLYGESLQRTRQVPIVGFLADGGKVFAPPETNEDAEGLGSLVTTLDAMDSFEAITVMTNSLFPAFRMGDTVFYRAPAELTIDMRALHGLECVCKIVGDDTPIIRQLHIQPDTRYTLIGYSGTAPMTNVRLQWASPVHMVRRAMPSHLSNSF